MNLALRSLRYYWRTNIAVVLGVATAVATLTGALLVGDSVRGSLRELANARLGRVDMVVTSAHFFREQLASDLAACPIIVLEGVVTNPENKRRAAGVQVYGVDARFWEFQQKKAVAGPRVNRALADELGLRTGDAILVRVEKPSAIPKESLHGRKEDAARTVRATTAEIVDDEFSLRAEQGSVRAVFLPLARLQRDLAQPGKVNSILIAGTTDARAVEPLLKQKATLADLGVSVRAVSESNALMVESDSAIISDALADEARGAAANLPLEAHPVFSYLANSIRTGDRETPYSLVTAVDSGLMPIGDGGIVLNDWTARDLNAKAGDAVKMDYFVWGEGGNLATHSVELRVERITPMTGLGADRNLTPEYPGITEAKTIRDWDPPFPMDLKRIRPKDEDYWNQYRTTPKAFIALATGQRLWASRFGRATSIRLTAPAGTDLDALLVSYRRALQAHADPGRLGMAVYSPRASSLESSRGSTDFGEYFAYFSFFLVVSALLLTGLFFRLGIEQRLREVGMLRAVGWSTGQVRSTLFGEGLVLALAGSVIGLAGAIGYCAFVLYGLRTWWRDAVGTSALGLHVSAESLAGGAIGGMIVSALSIWWTLHGLRRVSPRSLLAGSASPQAAVSGGRRLRLAALIAALMAVALLAAAGFHALDQTAGFFGGGALLLTAALMAVFAWLRSKRHTMLSLDHSRSLWNFGSRNAAHRPGRSFLCIALIASAAFLLVALDAFRQSSIPASDAHSGTGGFPLIAESQLPVFWDPNTPAGRESLNLTGQAGALDGVRFYSFRLRPGEDASCLNLYEPRNPRVLGAREDFTALGRFSFGDSLAQTPEEKANPWRLLDTSQGDGAVPAIVDANSMTYVLHRKLGDEFVINPDSARPVRVRLVATLRDSALQSELIVSEKNFIALFPDEQGYRVFLIDTPAGAAPRVMSFLEESLSDFGFDASNTSDRLAGYHRVENTYLSTFQALGALGLLLSTVGLAAVLLRNVLERRRELALLRALGFRQAHLNRIIVAENAFLVVVGLVTGSVCALIAILPAAASHGGHWPVAALVVLLVAVPATALLSSAMAVRSVARSPLLAALRAE